MVDPWAGRKGIDILTDIMAHMKPGACESLLKNLGGQVPHVATELRKRLLTFERLADCDGRGIQLLLKQISLADLALGLKGASQPVLQNIAGNMSKRAIGELQEEIKRQGPSKPNEIESARDRILQVARDLILKKQMGFTSNEEEMIT
ncbi:MAG: hypothetical protein HQM08_15370 [Candidatus Riflebacteria bacterium]|nr:hypothetical protein [Candidatus Riflebacteria bacterium]